MKVMILKSKYLNIFNFFIKISVLIAVFFILGTYVSLAEAATLQMSPSSGSYSVGQTFTTRVVVDSGGSQINAVESSIAFDTDVLSVVGVSKAGTVLSLWTTEPSYSNSAGTISFGGGNTSPFSGQSTLVTVTFRIKSEGSGTVSFNSGTVTAADGTGRDILSNMRTATYTGTSAPTPEPTPEVTPSVGTPSAPEVTSTTHPQDNPWHNQYEADFSWTVPNGVNAVRLLVGRQAEATPTVVYDPPISSRKLDDEVFDEEGLWYFHVQFRNAGGWGEITHYEFGFDKESPDEFNIEVTDGEGTANPTIAFEAEDELSGIKEYIIKIKEREDIVILSEEHEEKEGSYTFEDSLSEGQTDMEIVAYDNAGNETTSSFSYLLEKQEKTESPVLVDEEEAPGFFAKYGTTIFILFLILIILALLWYIWRLRKEIELNKKKGKREIKEVRDEIGRVFSALRDESEDLFASFDGKKGLSAKEKEAFKKIADALDVSEEIIGKEIDDVDKLME
jgi:hypothetical protein